MAADTAAAGAKNAPQKYTVIGRYAKGNVSIGFQLQDETGAKHQVDRCKMAYFVGRGLVNNVTAQLYKTSVLYRTKNGDMLSSLPVIGGDTQAKVAEPKRQAAPKAAPAADAAPKTAVPDVAEPVAEAEHKTATPEVAEPVAEQTQEEPVMEEPVAAEPQMDADSLLDSLPEQATEVPETGGLESMESMPAEAIGAEPDAPAENSTTADELLGGMESMPADALGTEPAESGSADSLLDGMEGLSDGVAEPDPASASGLESIPDGISEEVTAADSEIAAAAPTGSVGLDSFEALNINDMPDVMEKEAAKEIADEYAAESEKLKILTKQLKSMPGIKNAQKTTKGKPRIKFAYDKVEGYEFIAKLKSGNLEVAKVTKGATKGGTVVCTIPEERVAEAVSSLSFEGIANEIIQSITA